MSILRRVQGKREKEKHQHNRKLHKKNQLDFNQRRWMKLKASQFEYSVLRAVGEGIAINNRSCGEEAKDAYIKLASKIVRAERNREIQIYFPVAPPFAAMNEIECINGEIIKTTINLSCAFHEFRQQKGASSSSDITRRMIEIVNRRQLRRRRHWPTWFT